MQRDEILTYKSYLARRQYEDYVFRTRASDINGPFHTLRSRLIVIISRTIVKSGTMEQFFLKKARIWKSVYSHYVCNEPSEEYLTTFSRFHLFLRYFKSVLQTRWRKRSECTVRINLHYVVFINKKWYTLWQHPTII